METNFMHHRHSRDKGSVEIFWRKNAPPRAKMTFPNHAPNSGLTLRPRSPKTPKSIMKILPLALFATLLGAASGFAGSFGPPPFSNGSPLQSGTDGTYQATLSGTNMTGILSFAMQNGSQTGSGSQNQWVAFQHGAVFRGNVQANMVKTQITGILDSATLELPEDDDGRIELPVVFLIQGNRASGAFTANIDFEDPYGKFTGQGHIEGSTSDSITIFGIFTNVFGDQGTITFSTNLPSGTVQRAAFRLRGTRTSTSASGTAGSSTNG
ncbi:MAG TPA: hypothetical protein VIS74_01115 [Chthoniobacterales bacterium]